MLELTLVQQPGMWNQVIVLAQARFERIIASIGTYQRVDVYLSGKKIVSIDKITVAA